MHVVTIAARNYLPFARLLAHSFARHNPDAGFTTLVVDAEPGEIASEPDMRVITPSDLSLAPDEFARMAYIYDVTELSTALKPWALELLIDEGNDVAVYLDPDIYVYSSLDEIRELSHEHGIVLTPHRTDAMPRDGLSPTEADIMQSGIYNLGFIAVDAGNRAMLEWWQQRLLRDCISDPTRMLFTDQRWIDFVPSLYRHVILRDPGYNVAYWNLDSRTIARSSDESWLINDRPLRFFHFSGYRPENPSMLSKHAPGNPRVLLSEDPLLRMLCDDYGAAARTGGMGSKDAPPYRFNKLRDDIPMTMAMRRHYRDVVMEIDHAGGVYPPNEIVGATNPALLSWFLSPIAEGGSINWVLHEVWRARPDLKAAFPDPLGDDEQRFLLWARTHAVADGSIAKAELLEVAGGTQNPAQPPRMTQETGVNLAGYFQAELGVGQIGRLLVDAVRASALPYSIWRNNETVNRQQANFDDASESVIYPITIATINADAFGHWAAGRGKRLVNGQYTIGVWAWEIANFPDASLPALDLVDEVWGISTFCSDAIAAKTDKPVFTIPYQIPEPGEVGPLDRAAFGIGEAPYFFFAFDYQSVFERKNPLGLIAAFNEAFEPGEGPQLVIKTINGDRNAAAQERLRRAVAARSDIILIEQYVTSATVRALMAHAVAYVSLHRAEGYGLTMSESLALGTPVIATAYSGNLDFMDETNSLLVPYALREIGPGAAPYSADAQWAEPDISAAAGQMRWVIDHRDEARALGIKAQEGLRNGSTLSATIDFVQGRVRDIVAKGPKKRPATSPIARVRQVAGRAKRKAYRELPFLSSRDRLEAEEARTRDLARRLEQLAAERRSDVGEVHELANRLNATAYAVQVHDSELAAAPYQSDPALLRITGPDGRVTLGYDRTSGLGADYSTFEDVFRGEESFIAQRMRPYIDILRGSDPVLDVGCGRGELLALLADEGIKARGVDSDASMVQRCQQRSLDVELSDGIDVLRESAEGSWGAITAIEVVEHLEYRAVRDFVAESARTLRPGGVLLFETVNPHSPMSLKAFWLDPTHVRPLYPEAMVLLAREFGFESAYIMFLAGRDDLRANLRQCGEYALIARKS